MPTATITFEVSPEVADGLAQEAARRGHPSAAAWLAEFFTSGYAPLELDGDEFGDVPEPPPEVLAEVRRRQETPLSECRPAEEFFDELEARIKANLAARDPAKVSA